VTEKLRRLGPGVYVGEDDALHLDLPELCEDHGIPPTEENQAALAAAAREVFAGAVFEEHNDGGRLSRRRRAGLPLCDWCETRNICVLLRTRCPDQR